MKLPDHCPECGHIFEKAGSARSGPQHRRFFALTTAAYHNWPDNHPLFRPKSPDHMRYWLEMMAGHFTITKTGRINSTDPDKMYAFMRLFFENSDDHKLHLELDDNLLIQKKTRSIAYEKLEARDFGRLKDAVSEIIENEIGVAADRLLRERAA